MQNKQEFEIITQWTSITIILYNTISMIVY